MADLIFCVTNDLVHDRRMQRICRSLAEAGYDVTLVGRCYPDSPEQLVQPFRQVRMPLWFRRGKPFYLEYQIRLFFLLLFKRFDALVAIDLDTILPVALAGRLRGIPCIFDAHEDFTRVPELLGRPRETKVWEWVARSAIPHMVLCYTVGEILADRLSSRYGRSFGVIRNVPPRREYQFPLPEINHKVLWYHGTLNAGRGLEEVVQAMPALPAWQLRIAGDGVLAVRLETMIQKLGLEDRVTLLHWVSPDALWGHMADASIGLNLLDGRSESYLYSLANKTFDYVQAALPAIAMDFPEYRTLQAQGPIGELVLDMGLDHLVAAIRKLEDPRHYRDCQQALLRCRELWVWENEAELLIKWYRQILPLKENHG
jgi:glycosyltransferase involved in cell wall biosynthesis